VVDAYDDAADAARAAMVDRLRDVGTSDATLAAFARVPRDRLVPQFWVLAPPAGLAADTIAYRRGDPEGLEFLFDVDRAVAVNNVPGVPGGTTSTASAPRLLAAQADLLALEPGMSVLEIGTGPGYFAAVLAELVGENGRVVSIDIDGAVAETARAHLDAAGYAHVRVLARDGHLGAPDDAPFDRVVGSVGCADVAAAWLHQLAPNGFAVVPLAHGAVHPMVRVEGDGRGVVVTRSGYVAIQGRQEHARLWPHARAFVLPTDSTPLPPDLAAAVAIEPERAAFGGIGEWDLGYWVAIHDQRAGVFANLNDGAGSTARVDAAHGTLTWAGDRGPELADELLRIAHAWLDAGAPTSEDHMQRFVAIGSEPPDADVVIERVDHAQTITLGRSGRVAVGGAC